MDQGDTDINGLSFGQLTVFDSWKPDTAINGCTSMDLAGSQTLLSMDLAGSQTLNQTLLSMHLAGSQTLRTLRLTSNKTRM